MTHGRRGPRRALALGIVAILGLVAACSPAPGPTSPRAEGEPAVSPTIAPTPSPTPPPKPGHEVFGFIPYWEMDAGIADHVAATPLSTVALFSVTNTAKGAIRTGGPGYQKIAGGVGRELIRTAHDHGMRVELVFSSFGAERNRRLFEGSGIQAAVTTSLVALAGDLGVDGINVDVEGLDPVLVPAYGTFVGALRDALLAAGPGRQVSVATTANALGAAMALAATDSGADRVFMMAYDYRVGGSSPGATSPLARRDGSAKDLPASLDLYAALGVPVQRTILGLPLYGYAWPVAAPAAGDAAIGAPELGRGEAWILRRHLDVLLDPAIVPLYDAIESVEVYLLGSDGSVGPPAASALPSGSGAVPSPPSGRPTVTWQAVYVDTPATLATKMQLALDRGFAGVGFWAIGYERGLPGFTDLMRQFAAGKPLG